MAMEFLAKSSGAGNVTFPLKISCDQMDQSLIRDKSKKRESNQAEAPA